MCRANIQWARRLHLLVKMKLLSWFLQLQFILSSVGNWHGQYVRSNRNLSWCVLLVSRLLEPKSNTSAFIISLQIRILSSLFRKIDRDLPWQEPKLHQKFDAEGKAGARPWQKNFALQRRLADGSFYLKLDDQS